MRWDFEIYKFIIYIVFPSLKAQNTLFQKSYKSLRWDSSTCNILIYHLDIASNVNNVNSDNNCPSSDQEDTVHVKNRATEKGQRAGNQSGISGQQPIDRFMISAANSCETPNTGKQSIVVDRSPPTPAEVLNDESKKTKTGIVNSTKM